jgi:N12 class adenine-specific DNA methylase
MHNDKVFDSERDGTATVTRVSVVFSSAADKSQQIKRRYEVWIIKGYSELYD